MVQILLHQTLLQQFDTSIDLKMTVKHLLPSCFQIPQAPSKYQLTVPANSVRLSWLHQLAGNSEWVHGIWKWFEWNFFSTIIFISKLVSNLHKIFFYITWHQKPAVVILSDTYIQKLNSQEHTCNWVHICKRQQLASLPDEIPSCSSHFHGSQNCACMCRL